MTAINRTAYPRLDTRLNHEELAASYTLTEADLINRAVETLQVVSIDLPAFSTLDRLVNRLRAEVHERIYLRVSRRVTAQQISECFCWQASIRNHGV